MDEHVKPKISTIKYEFMLIYINLVWNKKKLEAWLLEQERKQNREVGLSWTCSGSLNSGIDTYRISFFSYCFQKLDFLGCDLGSWITWFLVMIFGSWLSCWMPCLCSSSGIFINLQIFVLEVQVYYFGLKLDLFMELIQLESH